MARGGRSRPRWPPETSRLEKAGRSRNTGRWRRSSLRRCQRLDAFTLQICGSGGSRRRNISLPAGRQPMIIDHNTPLGCAPGGVFVFGQGYLSAISGDDPQRTFRVGWGSNRQRCGVICNARRPVCDREPRHDKPSSRTKANARVGFLGPAGISVAGARTSATPPKGPRFPCRPGPSACGRNLPRHAGGRCGRRNSRAVPVAGWRARVSGAARHSS
jgi:hypothetical protein